MGVRRKTTNRRTLFRNCGTCGKSITTTADTPWVRQIPKDGRTLTTYFCCSGCFQASYRHYGWYDGGYAERKKARDAARDRSEWWTDYYARNGDRIRAMRMERYWANHEDELANNQYAKRKRKLLSAEDKKTATAVTHRDG